MSGRYVRRFDTRAERLVRPQGPVRMWGGQPVTHTGMILPSGRGGYRHSFNGCGCMGADSPDQGMPFMAWVILLGGGAVLAYTLFHSVKS